MLLVYIYNVFVILLGNSMTN